MDCRFWAMLFTAPTSFGPETALTRDRIIALHAAPFDHSASRQIRAADLYGSSARLLAGYFVAVAAGGIQIVRRRSRATISHFWVTLPPSTTWASRCT